ncbi:MAG: hypothetical protein KGL04_06700 [Elusimicrobia bacterium]|nr:hypothetical protein [Elusimicrobiota bacterium]
MRTLAKPKIRRKIAHVGEQDGPTQAATASAAILLDYPQEGEIITSSCYTFRIAPRVAAIGVDISIDQGPWAPCRESVGYWWYDWSGYAAGQHQASVRVRTADGRLVPSDIRQFETRSEPTA